MDPEYSEKINAIDHQILEELGRLERKEDQLSGLAKVYRELFQIQMEAELKTTVITANLSENLRRERLRAGIPLLSFEDFNPDWNQVQAMFNRIIAWSAADSDGLCRIHDLKKIGSDPDLLRETAGVWYRGLSLRGLPVSQEIDFDLLASTLGVTLKPFLSAYSKLLLPEVEQELWRRTCCPICGGKPDFSSLKEGGTRWLLCSRCDGEWLFSRIECPYCGTRNQEALAYFTSEEQPGYRIYVCEECRTYLKGIDSKGSGEEVLLPLERVLTLDLDRRGRENGYEPGWAIVERTRDFS